MALSPPDIQPCPELVEQWISLLACWATWTSSSCELAFTRAQCILPALCTFAISYANQSQIFTVNSLAWFASAFDWSKPTAYFLDQAASRHSARGLLTAASDPNFRNFAVQHRWHEHSETALVSLLHACAAPKTIRLLNAVLSSLEDLEFIIGPHCPHCQPWRCTLTNRWTLPHAHRLKSVCLALWLIPTWTFTVNWQTQAHSAAALVRHVCHTHANFIAAALCFFLTGSCWRLQQPCHHVPRLAALFVRSFCHHCLVFVAISAVCNTPRSCSAPLVCLRHAGPGAFVSARLGIVSSMTEENQAALTAMLSALRERDPRRLCQKPPFPRMSPRPCRLKGHPLKTFQSLR